MNDDVFKESWNMFLFMVSCFILGASIFIPVFLCCINGWFAITFLTTPFVFFGGIYLMNKVLAAS